MKPLLIVSALKDEIVELREQMDIEQSYRKDRANFFGGRLEGKPLVVGYTGIGTEATRAGLSMVTQLVSVCAVLGTGYAGGLIPELEGGSLVLAREIVFENKGPSGQHWTADASVIQSCRAALNGEKTWKEGRMVTVTQALTDPEQKQRVARESSAIAVDMESAAVAKLCQERGIPFGVLRAVLDPVTAHVPDPENFLDRSQRVAKRKVFSFVAKNPQAVWDLPRLANQASRARRRLTEVLPKVVGSILAAQETSKV